MELTDLIVETQPSLTLPWDETLILPVGDIQHGAYGADLDKFKRHMEWGMKQDAYFIGMGDYVDVFSPSGRQKFKAADFYDSAKKALADKCMEHLDEFYEVVKGSEGRWLTVLEGHHYFEFDDGKTSDTILAERLGAPFGGTTSLIQVRFKDKSRALTCQIWATHGQGSGVTMASPVNKLERMMSRFPTVDIFLVGHYSRKVAYPVDALVPIFGKNPRLKAKRRILACTGGFMKGYAVGQRGGGRAQGSYVEKAMLPPTNLGGIMLKIRPVHSDQEDRLDLNVEL